jgi:hypothetical protein
MQEAVRELSCQGDEHNEQSLRIAEVFAFEEDASSSLESGRRLKQKSPKGSALYVQASPPRITGVR